jgi:hypothetical protein
MDSSRHSRFKTFANTIVKALKRLERKLCMRYLGSSSLYYWSLKWSAVKLIRGLLYCRRPWTTAWRLIWPLFPWKRHYPPRLLSVAEIHADPKLVRDGNQLDHFHLRVIPLWQSRDTPLKTLYRIYEDACLGDDWWITSESTYFFGRKEWKVEDIPDPQDPDPARYRTLATIAELLADAFNSRIGLGLLRHLTPRDLFRINSRIESFPPMEERIAALERPPPWVKHVPPLKQTVSLFPPGKESSLVTGLLKEDNILGDLANLYFL